MGPPARDRAGQGGRGDHGGGGDGGGEGERHGRRQRGRRRAEGGRRGGGRRGAGVGGGRRRDRRRRGRPATGPARPAGAGGRRPALPGRRRAGRRCCGCARRGGAARAPSSTSWSWFGTTMPPGWSGRTLSGRGSASITGTGRGPMREMPQIAAPPRATTPSRPPATASMRTETAGFSWLGPPGRNHNLAHRISSAGVTPITASPERITAAVAATRASLPRVASGSSP